MAKQPQSEYLSLPLVADHYARARVQAQAEAGEFFDRMVGTDVAGDVALESPLEAIFYVWFKAYTTFMRTGLRLRAQVEVENEGQRFRVDFAVETRERDPHGLWRPIAVELDGHAFHEKTLEQVTYRNQRDRALQQLGWKVFHFSFSEITTRPGPCALEVVNFAHHQHLHVMARTFELDHPEFVE